MPAPPPASAWRPRLSAGCLSLLALLSLWHMFSPSALAVWTMGATAALFLVLEHKRVPAGVLRVALVLGALTLVLLPFSMAPSDSLRRGIAIGALMAALIGSVSLLARAALRSTYTQVVATHLLAQGTRQRYTSFSLACQLFGGMLGLAGVSMLMDMAARDLEPLQEDRVALFVAITRSFSAATLWSPMFSNTAILLALYPGLTWFAVLPLGLGLAAVVLVLGIGLDLWRLRKRRAAPEKARPADPLARALLPIVGAMADFLALVISVAGLLHVAVAAAIVILTPLAALVLNALQAPGPSRLARATAAFRSDFFNLPMMAGEVTLFMAAGCGGTVIASSIPPSWTVTAAALVSHDPYLACLALMLAVVALACIAVHPVLSAVLVASCFTPALLGLPALPHLCAILAGWAIAGSVTPFSMVNLMASRYSGVPLLTLSVHANHLFAILCLGIAATTLGSIALFSR